MRAGEDPDPGPSRTTLAELGERGLIARLRHRLPPPGPDVLVGIGDDAAAVTLGRGDSPADDRHLARGRPLPPLHRHPPRHRRQGDCGQRLRHRRHGRRAPLCAARPRAAPEPRRGRRRRAVRGVPGHGPAARRDARRGRHLRRSRRRGPLGDPRRARDRRASPPQRRPAGRRHPGHGDPRGIGGGPGRARARARRIAAGRRRGGRAPAPCADAPRRREPAHPGLRAGRRR